MRFQHSTTAGGDQEVAYEEFWRPMETRLNSVMPEFLRHYGMRNGKNVRKGDIYTACKFDIEKAKDVDAVKIHLSAMSSAALSYQKFISPEEEVDPRVSRRLQGILELDSTVSYPLLIRIFKDWKDDVISIDQVIQCLDLLESFYVRRLVCGVPTNALNKITLELCLAYQESNVQHWLQEKIQNGSGTRRCPNDEEFEQNLIVQRIYPRRRIARYMLLALEESFKHKEPVDTSSATMEHIMPQTLTDSWRSELGEKHSEIHDAWLDTIGNLTLTGYNAELGNASFSDKKEKLQNTHFELSRGLLSEDSWGASQIEARGKALAKLALRRWSLVLP